VNSFNELFRLFWRHSSGPNVVPSRIAVKKPVDGGAVFSVCIIVMVARASTMDVRAPWIVFSLLTVEP
jgi:hypothetical protein